MWCWTVITAWSLTWTANRDGMTRTSGDISAATVTSWDGNAFRLIVYLGGESGGFPSQRADTVGF